MQLALKVDGGVAGKQHPQKAGAGMDYSKVRFGRREESKI
jgi:hypothetical protein